MSPLPPPKSCALLLVDLQNDFIHPEGAYGRAGVAAEPIAALPERLAPLAAAMRAAGGLVISTHFTLVPGRGGAPLISSHLKELRPFLAAGDFVPGSWGHQLVDVLGPADASVEKVAYSAFYMSRLEWLIGRLSVAHLYVAGIVTNGGVASTVRDAHVRDMGVTVLSDGCAAFSTTVHDANIAALSSVARTISVADAIAEVRR
ncbi:MAG: cysteine hydrolase [Pseudomonadota bacterium]